MRRTASEVVRQLEMRVARLERQADVSRELMLSFLPMDGTIIPSRLGSWTFRFTHHRVKVGELHSTNGFPEIEVHIKGNGFKFYQLGREIHSAVIPVRGDSQRALRDASQVAINMSAR